jgi:glycerol-3-phosphate acyltransferase PlsY
LHYVVPILVSYLLGSITFSYVVGKWFKGIDIRQHGSGNAGATNTLRVLGVGPAILVLVLDLLKGVLAVWGGKWFAPDDLWVAVVCGLMVVAGHNWPIFFGFKGGKGIATTIGVTATLCFLPTLFAAIIAIVTIALTRYVSLGSLLFAVSLPILLWFMNYSLEIFLASLAFAIFAIIRHKSNIVKLVHGQENKLGAKQQ